MNNVQQLLKKGAKTWRVVAGEDSALERVVKKRYVSRVRTRSGLNHVIATGRQFALVRSRRGANDARVGVLLSGGCDLATAYTAAPLIAENVQGTVAIANIGTGSVLGSHRTDQVLQTLGPAATLDTSEAIERLNLTDNYFQPRLFTEPTFQIVDHPEFGDFPKTVVVLSVGSDLVRNAYRHRTDGYLVDPGGFWLNNLSEKILPDPEIARWFKKNFESIGRIDVADFARNMEEVIRCIRERLGSHIIVYNTLVVDPGSDHHNYQLLPAAHPLRRREFVLALSELSAKLDFHVVDIDRILKLGGVQEQVDFAHVPLSQTAPIGAEVYRILRELELVR